MPKFDWSNTQAASGGGVFTIPNDGYVCVITAAEWGTSTNGQPRLKLTWDVAEGPYAGVCANNGWYDSKHCDYISFSPSALRFAKQKLEAIAKSNPGFDPFAAWDAGRVDMFANRLVGINIQEEEYERDGEVKTRMNVCQVVDAQRVRDGKVKPRAKKSIGGGGKRPNAPTLKQSELYTGDVPFD